MPSQINAEIAEDAPFQKRIVFPACVAISAFHPFSAISRHSALSLVHPFGTADRKSCHGRQNMQS
jgi:hypothetical protein